MSSLSKSKPGNKLTSLSLVALAIGLGLGTLGNIFPARGFTMLADFVSPIGTLWLSALRMTVMPLVAASMLAAILSPSGSEALGRLGARAVFAFVAFLLAAYAFTLFVAPPLLSLYNVDPATVASMHAATAVPEVARLAAQSGSGGGSLGAWVGGLIPTNVFEALLAGNVLAVLLFTIFFGLALTRLPEDQRSIMARLAGACAGAMLQVVKWILLASPLGVFALTFSIGLTLGVSAAGMLVAFAAGECVILALFTLLLYPVSALGGGISLRDFAAALVPAQIVALTTRSSLAALPALVESGRDTLRFPTASTGFVLPLSASIFRLNKAVSNTWKLLFLAHIYGLSVSAGSMAAFVLTTMVISFSSLGIPANATAFRSLPAFLEAGVPIEGMVFVETIETIPDYFKTLLNVTGMMSVATILSRKRAAVRKRSTPSESQAPVGGIA